MLKSRFFRNSVLSVLLVYAGSTARLAANEPIPLDPQNGHYFVWNGKPTILVSSGEHYGAVLI